MLTISRIMTRWRVTPGNIGAGLVFLGVCVFVLTRQQSDSLSKWNGILLGNVDTKAEVTIIVLFESAGVCGSSCDDYDYMTSRKGIHRPIFCIDIQFCGIHIFLVGLTSYHHQLQHSHQFSLSIYISYECVCDSQP